MFVCCGCKLTEADEVGYKKDLYMLTRTQTLLHLKHHRLVGHKFPRRAEQMLRQELKTEGETFQPYHDGAPCIVCGVPLSKEKR